jgi:hypothetical protein
VQTDKLSGELFHENEPEWQLRQNQPATVFQAPEQSEVEAEVAEVEAEVDFGKAYSASEHSHC